MSRGLNKVQLIGRLGADPEMRYTPQGTAVTNFRMATGGRWTDRNGTERDDTEWFRVEAWERLAETCDKYLSKGREVYVEGRLKTRKYTDKDGIERRITEVVANNIVLIGNRGDVAYDDHADDRSHEDDDESAETAPRSGGNQSRRNQPQPVEEEDDIPF